jgi:lysophospholipase L1-like esterase
MLFSVAEHGLITQMATATPAHGRTRKFLWIGAIVLAGISMCLSTWKMFQFHDRLVALENPQWERTLADQHLYARPIVLFGDSQIANWPVSTSFGALPVLNRGVGGDWAVNATTRFKQEVIPLNPSIVVILIGTNDVAHQQPVELVLSSIRAMVSGARERGATVIVCSLLPARGEAARVRPNDQLKQLNSKLQKLAAEQGASYSDLYSALADNQGELPAVFSDDGLHLNSAGYLRITSVLLPQLLLHYVPEERGVPSSAADGLACAVHPPDSLLIPQRIRLIEIDAEGHDLQVLQGTEKLIERDRPLIIVEG